jgi:hypothetical protein
MALDTNYLWSLGVHKHEAPAEERLLPKIIKSVLTQRSD